MNERAIGSGAGSVGGAATTGAGRVGNLDVLRAVAAFGVLAGHAYSLSGRFLPVRAERWYDVVLMSGAAGVWLFFAISGYVIAKPFIDRLVSGQPLPDLVPYAIRRSLRIFPLYWVALTTVIAMAGAGAAALWHYPVHYALLHNLVPGRQGSILSVAWTLTLELLFYIAVPVLAIAIRRRRPAVTAERLAGLVMVSWAASILFAVGAGLHGPDQTGVWLRGSLPAMWQMFCPGILLAIGPHLRAGPWRRWVVERPAGRMALVVALVALPTAALLAAIPPLRFGFEAATVLTDLSRPLYAVGFGIVIAAAIRARAFGRGRGGFVLHLGLVSYGIYLLHAVILTALVGPARALVPLPREGLAAYGVHLVFLAGLTVIAASVSWRLFERPLIGLAGTLSERWRARAQLSRGAGPSHTARLP